MQNGRGPRVPANHTTTAAQQTGLHMMEGLRFLLSKNIVKNWMIQKRSTHLYDLALPDVSLRVEGLFHLARGGRKARPRLRPQPCPAYGCAMVLTGQRARAEARRGGGLRAGSGRWSGQPRPCLRDCAPPTCRCTSPPLQSRRGRTSRNTTTSGARGEANTAHGLELPNHRSIKMYFCYQKDISR